MEENIKNQEAIDPRDLNGDGKVTLKEKVQYTAGQAVDKAKDMYADAKEKTVEVAGKVADKSKELYAEAKDKADDLKDKAADALDTAKQKLQEKRGEKEA